MQVDIAPESDHAPHEDNFFIESSTLVRKSTLALIVNCGHRFGVCNIKHKMSNSV